MIKNDLTPFQMRCEELLTAALQKMGKSVINRKVEGHPKPFVVGKVAGHDITFYIYADGADYKTPASHSIFEKQDFGSLDELSREFTISVLEETRNKHKVY